MELVLAILGVFVIVTIGGIVYIYEAVKEAHRKVLKQRHWIGWWLS